MMKKKKKMKNKIFLWEDGVRWGDEWGKWQ